MEKVIDIEERIPTLRERRRRRTNRKFLALLFIILILLAALIYSQSKYSEIQTISVSGASIYDDEKYIEASTLAAGDSMWSFNSGEIEQTISGLEWVETAAVDKKWLTGVEITVSEFPSIGYLENDNGYQKLLSNGYAVELPVETVDGPVFTNVGNPEIRLELSAQLERLDSEVSNMLSQLVLTDGETETADVTLYMTDGNEIRAKLNTLAEKLNYYPSLIAQLDEGQNGVFDMEVGITFRSFDDVYGPPKEAADEETEQP
ncbi:cell division protein FtsQ/DivIB [Planococcus salinarum]|uniref:cell division protein FtsQ/DivIB n=1 Tax=Planococcus salinarum TaxID=622695 RepID=UPI000E3C3978|nr:FtsQ-type POTRA domain-containing protein [Planococcus salinarum]TAA68702.1 FtsQ-type POTRA domain-containing protein [Planococcus salinarum]